MVSRHSAPAARGHVIEHIVSFLPSSFPNEDRFVCEMAGETFPDKNYKISRATSNFYCFEYVISGTGYVNCNGDEFHPKAGDVYLLPPGTSQYYRASPKDPFDKVWMNIRGSLCDALYKEYNLQDRYYYPQKDVLPLFRSFLTLCEENNDNAEYVSLRGSLMVHNLFALLASGAAPAVGTQAGYAREAKHFIDQNVTSELSVPLVARHVGISVSQLNRTFSKEYGITPHRYYTKNRMQLAATMLRDTNLPIQEIARKLYFNNTQYFSSAFKSSFGVSPLQFRKTSVA